MNKWIIIALILTSGLQTYAFEDFIVTTDHKIVSIETEHKTMLDVYPITTIMNKKNTIFFHPIKEGETKVHLKNEKEKEFIFNIIVSSETASIENVEGFEIISIDNPPEAFEIDLPPTNINQEAK